MMTDIAIRRIQPLSALKFGALVGGLTMFLPGLLLGVIVRVLVGILRAWLDGWTNPSALGVEINLLNLVNLQDFLQSLRGWDDQGWLLILLVMFGTMFVGGLLNGVLLASGAASYNSLANISGGFVISTDILSGPHLSASQPYAERSYSAVPNQTHVGATAHAQHSVPPAAHTQHQIPPAARQRSTMPSQVAQSSAQTFVPQQTSPAQPASAPKTVMIPSPASQNVAPNAWLVSRQNANQRVQLKAGTTTLGSAPDNQIPLNGLAPYHAEIRFENNMHIIYDLSHGQTSVNGRPISGANMIKNGFQIRLGAYDLIFQTQ